MRGKKAKAIRREVYGPSGDKRARLLRKEKMRERVYDNKIYTKDVKGKKGYKEVSTTIYYAGLRRLYKNMKKVLTRHE